MYKELIDNLTSAIPAVSFLQHEKQIVYWCMFLCVSFFVIGCFCVIGVHISSQSISSCVPETNIRLRDRSVDTLTEGSLSTGGMASASVVLM